MAESPGTSASGSEKLQDVSYYLELFEKAPSEHAKIMIIIEKLVPWIQSKQSKGAVSSVIADCTKSARPIVFLAFYLLYL
jgi:hypothetical protein